MFIKYASLCGCVATLLFSPCGEKRHQSEVRRRHPFSLTKVSRICWHLVVKRTGQKQRLFSKVTGQSCSAAFVMREGFEAEPHLHFVTVHQLPDSCACRLCVLSFFCVHLCIHPRLAGVCWCSPRVCFPCFISISNSFGIWKSITPLLSEKQDQGLAPRCLTQLRWFVLIEDSWPRSILKRGLLMK